MPRKPSEPPDIESNGSVTVTRRIGSEVLIAGQGGPPCCLSWIRFKALYPGEMTVIITSGDGRTITRRFDAQRRVRTAFMRSGTEQDDDNQSTIVLGGLGPCIDMDVGIVDVNDPTLLRILHYQFRLCCANRYVQAKVRLVHSDRPTSPTGHVVKLPLLEIIDLRRDNCPR